MNKLIPAFALAGVFAVSAQAQGVINVTETFASGQRTTLNTPNGFQWFSSAGGANVTYTDNTSIFQAITPTAGRHLIGYFTADGSPFTLAQGQTLTLSFTVTFNRGSALTDSGNNFRVGLFDSTAGNRMSADNHGGTNDTAPTPFDNYTGYAAMFNLGASTGNTASIRERTDRTNRALISSINAYTTVGGTFAPDQAFAPNTAYTGTFSFTRTAEDHLSMSVSFTGGALSGYSFTRVDEAPSTFAFDMIAFQMSSNTADGFTLSSVNVTAVPEPSAFAALAGLGGLAFAAARRRR
jgi:hypothetical protein